MAKLNFWRNLFTWLFNSKGIQKDRDIYEVLKQEKELAPKSKKCAVRSIMFSLLMYVLIGATFVAIYFLWKNPLNAFLNIFLTIFLAVIMLYSIVACYIRSIINLVNQFRLNKKAHTWIALVMAIIPTLLVIVAVSILATSSFNA